LQFISKSHVLPLCIDDTHIFWAGRIVHIGSDDVQLSSLEFAIVMSVYIDDTCIYIWAGPICVKGSDDVQLSSLEFAILMSLLLLVTPIIFGPAPIV
jgi:hypothetical protein